MTQTTKYHGADTSNRELLTITHWFNALEKTLDPDPLSPARKPSTYFIMRNLLAMIEERDALID